MTPRTATHRLSRVREAAAVLAGIADADEALRVLMAYAQRGLDAQASAVGVLSGQGDLHLVSTAGLRPSVAEAFRVVPSESPTPMLRAAQRHSTVLVESAAQMEEEFPALPPSTTGLAATASVPMVIAGDVLGVLGVGFAEDRRLSRDELDALHLLAAVGAGVLAHLRLPERLSSGAPDQVGERAADLRRHVADAQRAADRLTRLQQLTEELGGADEEPAVVALLKSYLQVELDAGVLVLAWPTDRPEQVDVIVGSAEARRLVVDPEAPLARVLAGEPLDPSTSPAAPAELHGLLDDLDDRPQTWAWVSLGDAGAPYALLLLGWVGDRPEGAEDLATLAAARRLAAQSVERLQARRAEREEQARNALLAEASLLLDASLDIDETLSQIARIAVPALADTCVVRLLSEDRLRLVAATHVDGSRAELLRRVCTDLPPRASGLEWSRQVMASGRGELVQDVDLTALRDEVLDDEQAVLLRALGARSSVCVPLVARSRSLGTLTFSRLHRSRALTPADADLLDQVAARAALAVDSAHLHQQLAEAATSLQRALLPPHLPDVGWVRLAAAYLPGDRLLEVGGDFYDAWPVAAGDTDGWLDVVVGDVCGRGADAAGVTGLARYTLAALVGRVDEPAAALTELNATLRGRGEDGRFLTAVLARLTRTERGASVVLACAGHPAPVVIRASGQVEVSSARGTLIGVFPEVDLPRAELDLAAGDTLLLYTDGVLEARGPEGLFGTDRLLEVVRRVAGRPPEEVVAAVEEAVARYRSEGRDDVAVLAVQVPPDPCEDASRSHDAPAATTGTGGDHG